MTLFKDVDYNVKPFFIKILILSVIVYMCTAWFSVGYYHGDEHFQLIEFANYKLGNSNASQLAWEFNDQIRPGFQPAIVYGFLKICHAIGIDNAFVQVRILRYISMLFFLSVLYALSIYTLKKLSSIIFQKVYILVAFLLWFMPFLAVRFASEIWSALFFIAGFLLIENAKSKTNSWVSFIFGGLVLGLSFQLRYQLFFMILGYLLWNLFIQKKHISFFLFVKLGIVLSLLIGVLCDSWLYNEFVFTPWFYFKSNIILNKAVVLFGSSPWWYYFTAVFNKALFPFGLILIICVLMFYIILPKHVFTWITLPFVLVHILISHKELRFLFPLILIVIVMLFLLIQELTNRGSLNKIKKYFRLKHVIILFLIFNTIPLFIVCFAPANNAVKVLSILDNKVNEKPAKVYYIEQNPMSPFGLPFTFYKLPKQVQFIHVESPDSINTMNKKENVFLVINQKSKRSNYTVDESKFTCLFSSIPLWLRHGNFNNWIGRTTVSQLYELKK